MSETFFPLNDGDTSVFCFRQSPKPSLAVGELSVSAGRSGQAVAASAITFAAAVLQAFLHLQDLHEVALTGALVRSGIVWHARSREVRLASLGIPGIAAMLRQSVPLPRAWWWWWRSSFRFYLELEDQASAIAASGLGGGAEASARLADRVFQERVHCFFENRAGTCWDD